ncbi:hypothetical protein L1887_44658 [Cichorium endivia]|nr:hypothetical protein L1887_44658 [Cichorium endivia]
MVVTGDGELGFRFRRGSLRNGYHIQGRQQARKLPNPDTGARSWTLGWVGRSAFRCGTGLLVPSVGDALLALTGGSCLRRCYFEEIRVLKASLRSIIAIVGLQRGFLVSASHQLALTTSLPFVHTARRFLPIEWSGEVLGSRRRGRFAAGDVARIPLNLIS